MISEYGCDTILNFPIDVYPLPTAAFTPTPRSTTAALPKFSFNNESNVNPILGSTIVLNEWDFGDPLTNDDTSTRRNAGWFYGADTATYQVTLKVTTNYGCTDSTFDFVQVGPDILVYIPNAFSPDGSGPLTNDRFRVVASGFKTYEMIIFNRWGEKLFESTDITEGWDGNYQGQPCQQDVYAYLAKFTNFKGEEFVYDGTITLIR
jgi:gliding motility-associated-like protein